jgi:hypothetical protein
LCAYPDDRPGYNAHWTPVGIHELRAAAWACQEEITGADLSGNRYEIKPLATIDGNLAADLLE